MKHLFVILRQKLGKNLQRIHIKSKRVFPLSEVRYIVNLELITDTQEYLGITSTGNNCGAVLWDIASFRQSDYYRSALDNNGYPIWFDTTANWNLIHKFRGSTNGIGNTFTVMTAFYPPQGE